MRAAKSIVRFSDALPYGFGIPSERTLIAVFVGRLDSATPRRSDHLLSGDFQLHLPNGDAFASKLASVGPDFIDTLGDDFNGFFGFRVYAVPANSGAWEYGYVAITA